MEKNSIISWIKRLGLALILVIVYIIGQFTHLFDAPGTDHSNTNHPDSNSTVSGLQGNEADNNPSYYNRTMMQMFEWYLPNDGSHWRTLSQQAGELGAAGINMVWLPPAYKGQSGIDEVGYGVYDTYDLGEFDQKGTIRTKYGTKEEYLSAIDAFHETGMEVIADIVLNHRMGADYAEDVMAYLYKADDRSCQITDDKGNPQLLPIKAWTGFNFPGRQDVYSDFHWNASHFTGVDYDANQGDRSNTVYLFDGKSWDDDVDQEKGNYDYLMGADLDLNNPEVFEELVHFGKWYVEEADLDGFRLDAVKHMCAPFYQKWVEEMRKPLTLSNGEVQQKEMFTVGEYWSSDLSKLQKYLQDTEGTFSLFDVPLHMHLYEASTSGGYYDMRNLFKDTLTDTDSWHSVTFVDNHDTQPGQALPSFVNAWFKEIAYAILLMQERGIPCVFYGDYYGIPHDGIAPVEALSSLTALRQSHAYGMERDYYDDPDVVGFTREGKDESSGLALLCSDGPGGSKWMEVGKMHAGQTFVDALGHCQQKVTINQDGWGEFFTDGGAVSVWIPEKE